MTSVASPKARPPTITSAAPRTAAKAETDERDTNGFGSSGSGAVTNDARSVPARPPAAKRRRPRRCGASRRRAPSPRARGSAFRPPSAPRRVDQPGGGRGRRSGPRSASGGRAPGRARWQARPPRRSARSNARPRRREARGETGKPDAAGAGPGLSIAPAAESVSPPPSRSSVETASARGPTSAGDRATRPSSPPAWLATVVPTAVSIRPRSASASRSAIPPEPAFVDVRTCRVDVADAALQRADRARKAEPAFGEPAGERVEQRHQPARTWIQVRKIPPGANAFDSTNSPALPEIGFPSRSRR